MITRRAFLASLSALPFVGKFIPQRPAPIRELTDAEWPYGPPYPPRWAIVRPDYQVRIQND